MDIKRTAKECEGCFVDIVMADGSARRGTIQELPTGTKEDLVALLDEGKSKGMRGRRVAVPISEYLNLVDLIPLDQVKTIMKVETTIAGMVITSEHGRPILEDGTGVEIKTDGKAGYVRVRWKMPGSDTWSSEREVRIVNRGIALPVTMVFISYAKENRRVVEEVVKTLRRNDIFVWDDASLLLPGDNWESKIERAISSADYFLLFLSAGTIQRDGYKNRELRLALKEQSMKGPDKRFLIPLLIDKCDPPDDLRQLQWLHMWEEGWETRLLRAIGPSHVRGALYR